MSLMISLKYPALFLTLLAMEGIVLFSLAKSIVIDGISRWNLGGFVACIFLLHLFLGTPFNAIAEKTGLENTNANAIQQEMMNYFQAMGVKTTEGFQKIMPIVDRVQLSDSGRFTGVFTKPPTKLHLVDVQIKNTQSNRYCMGNVRINQQAAQKSSQLPSSEASFSIEVGSCDTTPDPRLDPARSMEVLIQYQVVLGNTQSSHISKGVIHGL